MSYATQLIVLGLLTLAGLAVAVLGEWLTRRTGGYRGRTPGMWERQPRG